MANVQQRAVIKFLVKSGESVQDIQNRLKNVFGENSPSLSSIRKWSAEFKRGRTSIEDDPRAGRPKTVTTQNNVEKLEAIIRTDRRIREGDIGCILNFTKSTVHHILTKVLMMKKFTSKWVPSLLSAEQKLKRLNACHQNLQLFNQQTNDFLNRYLALDEICIHYSAPDEFKGNVETTTTMPIETCEDSFNSIEDDNDGDDDEDVVGHPKQKRPRRQPPVVAGKVRLSIFWNIDGLLLINFHESKHKQTSEYDRNTLDEYYECLLAMLRQKLIKNGYNLENKEFLFHQDCMLDERPILSKQEFIKYNLLEQPEYSPDLFPGDFYIDLNLKKFLVAKRFSNDNELMMTLKDYFNSLTPNYFREGILALKKRYEKCIQAEGDYIDAI